MSFDDIIEHATNLKRHEDRRKEAVLVCRSEKGELGVAGGVKKIKVNAHKGRAGKGGVVPGAGQSRIESWVAYRLRSA